MKTLQRFKDALVHPKAIFAAFGVMLLLQLVAAAVRNTYVITLHSHGFTNQMVGLVTALDSAGCLVAKLFFAALLLKLGIRKLNVICLTALALLLPFFPLVDKGYWIIPVAFAIGATTAIIFDLVTLAVTSNSKSESRGLVIAVLGMFGGIGGILGLEDVRELGTSGEAPFLLISSLVVGALLTSRWMTLPGEHDGPETETLPPGRFLIAHSGILAVSLMAGLVMAGFQSTQLLFAEESLGLSSEAALALVTVASVGRTLLPLLIGALGDLWGAQKVMVGTALLCAVLLTALSIFEKSYSFFWISYFIIGGAGWSVYVLGLSAITQATEGEANMAQSVAIYGFSGRVGTILSPVIVGASMDRLGSDAFLWLLLAGYLVTAVLSFFVFRSKPVN